MGVAIRLACLQSTFNSETSISTASQEKAVFSNPVVLVRQMARSTTCFSDTKIMNATTNHNVQKPIKVLIQIFRWWWVRRVRIWWWRIINRLTTLRIINRLTTLRIINRWTTLRIINRWTTLRRALLLH